VSNSLLFTPQAIASLTLPNRLVRSATAERMADEDGSPRPTLIALYRELVLGEVGLIITGHMYVQPSGKAHAEMTGIYSDSLVAKLAKLTDAVHALGGKIVVQINHGGMQCDPAVVPELVAPSAVAEPYARHPARQMSSAEISSTIDAFAQAARRAKESGFDGVQIHGAHGYLISQFLSPATNRRTDEWGGDLAKRMAFLGAVCAAIRSEVGSDYPVLIKLGAMDGIERGLSLSEGSQVIAALESMGLDGVEISCGIGGPHATSIRKGIQRIENEAYFRPWARQARQVTQLPILLVGGLRSRLVMEQVLHAGEADFVSLCRPLICEPDLPRRFEAGLQDRSRCISANRCWAEGPGVGIGCKCPLPHLDVR